MRLLFLEQWLSGEILKAIGWTLVHSLWQGLIAAVLAGIVIISTRKSVARLRYNLLGAVLVLFMVVTVITFSQQLKNGVAAERSFTELTIPVTATSFAADGYETIPAPARTTIDKFVTYFNTNADLFVLIWAVFFLVHCIKLFAGLAGVQRLRNYRTHIPPGEWQTKLNHLSQLLGIKRSVSLLQSELVKVPVAIGFFKPVILVPLGLLSNIPPEQVETILLHELGHIRRKDYLVNILQRLTEAVFFFNPALLWISSLIRQEREACCDDIVVANTTHKGSYLEALVSFQEYSLAATGYAMAISSKRHYLLNRVKRMVTRENKKLNSMEKIVLVISLVAVTAFTFIPKNETTTKNNLTVINAVKVPSELKPTPGRSLRVSAPLRKPVTKKENKKDVLEVSVETPPVDTIPPPVKEKEKTGDDERKFLNLSTMVNDDGKTRTETVEVTDKDGKKYAYTKLNNKVTRLSIDGKAIPENEIGNYAQLFERVEIAQQENRARRLIDMERRKVERAKRTEDLKGRTAEKSLLREYQNRQKRDLFEQNRKSRLFERTLKNSENQRTQRMRLLEKTRKQRMLVPTINGREVVSQNNKTENCEDVAVNLQKILDVNLQRKVDVNLQNNSRVILQKMVDVSLQKKSDMNLQNKLDVNTQNKIDVNMQNKIDLNLQKKIDLKIQKKPGTDLQHEPVVNHDAIRPDQHPLVYSIQNRMPAKLNQGARLSKETQPLKTGKNLQFIKRRITT